MRHTASPKPGLYWPQTYHFVDDFEADALDLQALGGDPMHGRVVEYNLGSLVCVERNHP
jgi:hypothetical protein